MVIIYVVQINPRVLYSFRLLLTSILGIQVKVTSNKAEYEQAVGPKLNYSRLPLSGLSITPHALLFETGIHDFDPEMIWIQQVPCLFPVTAEASLPFDPFAAAFFMVSRYEEYREQPLDNHGRVMATESFAFKHDFLEIPVVDKWAYMLKSKLGEMFPELEFPERHYRHIPTVDIDIAYAYRHHGWLRSIGGILKKIGKGNLKDLSRQFKTLVLKEKDPYDVFDLLQDWYLSFRLQPVFFFLVGNLGQYDRNINAGHASMQQLIHRIGRTFSIGIHPSYASNFDYELLKDEIQTLQKIKGKKVIRSRQHFLKLSIPSTYLWLMQCSIEKDYSMGYASLPGFRAGTCTPFLFYDISSERETSLVVYPFHVMDGTLIDYMQLAPEEGIQKISEITAQIRSVDGTFISLWHNVTLSEIGIWKNWRTVYVQMLEANY